MRCEEVCEIAGVGEAHGGEAEAREAEEVDFAQAGAVGCEGGWGFPGWRGEGQAGDCAV